MKVQQNLEFVRHVFESGWNRQEFAFLEGRTAPLIRMNYNGTTTDVPFDSLPGLVQFWRSAFPDLEFEVRHLVGEGDLVAVSLVMRGTHLGEWWGIPPSGNAVEVEEMMFFRFDSGSLVEMWEVFDEATLRSQLTTN